MASPSSWMRSVAGWKEAQGGPLEEGDSGTHRVATRAGWKANCDVGGLPPLPWQGLSQGWEQHRART